MIRKGSLLSFALPIFISMIVLFGWSFHWSQAEARVVVKRDTDWLLEGKDGDNTHFSPLSDINDRNVNRLGLLWSAELPTGDGSVGTPLIADGVIYQSASFSQVIANDLRTGRLLWAYRPEIQWTGDPGRHWGLVNRGIALLDEYVFVNTGGCRLIALDRHLGRQVWDADVCGDNPQLTLNSMPHVGKGKVFVGTSNSDFGTSRCHFSAFDAKNGRRLWRFYTAPGDPLEDAKSADPDALKKAASTWGRGYLPAGVCPWNSVHYDEKLDLLFVGTGGPAPFNRAARGEKPGLELYSNSILALNPDTGKLVWSYQITPEDLVNYEAVQSIVVADLPFHGVVRRVVLQAAKNGFFFVLDAKTGQFLSANNYVPVNWTDGINPQTGRLSWRKETHYWEQPSRSFRFEPSGMGAHNFQPMAVSSQTLLAYIPAIELAQDYEMADGAAGYGGLKVNLSIHADSARTPLIAWDPIGQRERWRVDRPMPLNSGLLATAGNLVFQGLGSGEIEAYRADSGKRLWSFQTSGIVAAAPITARIDGRQLLLAYSGNGGSSMVLRGWRALSNAKVKDSTPRLLAFALDGAAKLKAQAPLDPLPRPVAPRPEASAVGDGPELYEDNCAPCHGQQTLAVRGLVPDLRRSQVPSVAGAFRNVVLDGVRVKRGMPRFDIDAETLEKIRAYILQQSWTSYEMQARGKELQPKWP